MTHCPGDEYKGIAAAARRGSGFAGHLNHSAWQARCPADLGRLPCGRRRWQPRGLISVLLSFHTKYRPIDEQASREGLSTRH
jgi:hypothetical protein